MSDPAGVTRVAAYAVIVRGGEVLLSRLAPYLTTEAESEELWTLPGGGVEFGERPRDAVVREVHEETGLDAVVGEEAWVDSQLFPARHAIRLVYEGWVAPDAPAPHVVEVAGTTVDAAWHPVAAVLDGSVPATAVVRRALGRFVPHRRQRLSAYGLARRMHDGVEEVLLTRISARGVAPGTWTLPGGGVEHGETPAVCLRREMCEETGLEAQVGALLGVHDTHFTGTAPTGRLEDFHGVHLLFDVTVAAAEPHVVETDGTTDAVAWMPVADVGSGRVPVFEVVRFALAVDS